MEMTDGEALINNLIERLQDTKKVLNTKNLTHGDLALVYLDLSDVAFSFAEALSQQQKFHMGKGLESIRAKQQKK